MKTIRPLLGLFAFAILLISAACGQFAAKPTPTPTAPVWPPAGTLAIGRTDESRSNSEIYLIQTDGTSTQQLTQSGGRTDSPAYSPDGSKIAYHHNSGAIWVMNADGSDRHRLTVPPAKGGSWPAWSLDGKQIVYNTWDNVHLQNCDEIFQIYIINVDGSDNRQLTKGPLCNTNPSFTPDGKILFLGQENHKMISNGGEVFEMNPDGTGLVKLPTSGHIGWYALSPDGSLLAVHDMFLSRIDIITMDGSQPPRTLLDNDYSFDWAQMAWSPDGKALAIARAPGLNPVMYGAPAYIVNVDGSGLTRIPNIDNVWSIAWKP